MQGNRLSQRMLAELVGKIEGEQTAVLTNHYTNMVEYKVRWEAEIDRCRRSSLPEPKPLPHPADILIDARTGEIRIVGPMTSEEKAYYESIVVLIKVLQSQITRLAADIKRARSGARRDGLLADLHDFQRQFDQLNDVISPSFRTELRDRSNHPDASKAGEFARRMGIKLPGPPPPLKLPDLLLRLLDEPD